MATREKLTEVLPLRLTPSMKKAVTKEAHKNHREPPAEIRLAIEKHLRRAK